MLNNHFQKQKKAGSEKVIMSDDDYVHLVRRVNRAVVAAVAEVMLMSGLETDGFRNGVFRYKNDVVQGVFWRLR